MEQAMEEEVFVIKVGLVPVQLEVVAQGFHPSLGAVVGVSFPWEVGEIPLAVEHSSKEAEPLVVDWPLCLGVGLVWAGCLQTADEDDPSVIKDFVTPTYALRQFHAFHHVLLS